MRKTLAILVLLTSFGVSAGTITSLDPSTVTAKSGEYFMTIYGSGLGDQLQFDGPAGSIVLDINARGTDNVVGWIPMAIANQGGTYTVRVLGGQGGDTGPATFHVVDPTTIRHPFVILLPEAVVAVAKGKTAIVRYEVSATGGDDPNPSVKCDPPSGSFLPVGRTSVNCEATNQFGESAKGGFPVYVHDATQPVIKVPGRISVPADAREGSFVKFEVNAVDEVDGKLVPQCDRKSNSLFPVGITTVECLATDLSLNTVRGAFTIEVVDKDAKFELHVPESVFAEAESREGARVPFDVYVTGTLDPSPKITCDPPSESLFGIGTKFVSCTATDSFGESDEGRFEVTVADLTPPLIERIKATPSIVEASGDYVSVAIDVNAIDTVDPKPRCAIAYVAANEGIGSKDWSLISDLELKLKATTTGADDRIYRIIVVCGDESRNQSIDEALVTVTSRGGESPQSTETTRRRRAARP